MGSRRPGTALTLIGGAVLLLVAIAVGQRLGDRVLSQATEQRLTSGLLVTPVPQASDDPYQARNWKREQVVSVATDPGFPDPRVTPRPTPTPRPTANPPTPPPTAPPTPVPVRAKLPDYTSPPLPLPIASHRPEEIDTEPPDANGYPQGIPPATPDPAATHTP